MKKLLLTTTALLALSALPANAGLIADNLTIVTLPANLAVPQSQSEPCLICATQQAHQPTVDLHQMGFNNFVNTGNETAFKEFSSNVFGDKLGQNVQGTPYTAGYLDDVISAIAGKIDLSFNVVIDINTATGKPGGNMETLNAFWLIDLDKAGATLQDKVIFALDGPIVLPNTANGNGKGDYLISGFDLSGVNKGDRLIFFADWDHASDGGESFYLVPVPGAIGAVPEISTWAMMGIGFAFVGLFGMKRRGNFRVA